MKGMTLIEVMIALVITTVGLLGALAMVGSLYTGSAFNRSATEAMTLAQSKVEQANSMVIALGTTPTGGTETNLDAYGGSSGKGTMYKRVTTWSASGDGTRYICNVEVSWTDGTGSLLVVNMSTERIPNS